MTNFRNLFSLTQSILTDVKVKLLIRQSFYWVITLLCHIIWAISYLCSRKLYLSFHFRIKSDVTWGKDPRTRTDRKFLLVQPDPARAEIFKFFFLVPGPERTARSWTNRFGSVDPWPAVDLWEAWDRVLQSKMKIFDEFALCLLA